ncbi:hypothetical protein PFICI_07009 [Pestalotiopsis fici W106-1]|uniref:Uncharacterized protein n=1 Tax=Pestalotiopsis fici (strain W106-1 / CGMCC3.15140) TaxID=1229662 RepID=W3X9C5_PESFW|nr:uncharacterized protein PFICI_07009 [Pestalotiopsis fici W106-1]ETS82007.1 hypothetical protein PFICI_07009 [Pestalotiopsis fici W106-1]
MQVTNVMSSGRSAGISTRTVVELGTTVLETISAGNYNSSGSVNITGWDLTQPWPGDFSTWSISTYTAADIPATLIEDDGTQTSGYVTGTSTNVRQLDESQEKRTMSLRRDTSNSTTGWTVCAIDLGRVEAADDEGLCKEALGEQCTEDLVVAGMRTYNSEKSCHGSFVMPSSCEDLAGHNILSSKWLKLTRHSLEALNLGQNVSDFTIYTGIEDGDRSIHQLGNYTAYDRAANYAHVTMLIWAGTNKTVTSSQMVGLACPRSTTAVRDSQIPNTSMSEHVSFRLFLGFMLLSSLSMVL